MRAPESVMHEVDYWQQVLLDVRALNDLILEASQPLPGIPTEVLGVLLGMDSLEATKKIGAITTGTLDSLAKMGDVVQRMLQLVEGRELSIRREVHGDDDER